MNQLTYDKVVKSILNDNTSREIGIFDINHLFMVRLVKYNDVNDPVYDEDVFIRDIYKSLMNNYIFDFNLLDDKKWKDSEYFDKISKYPLFDVVTIHNSYLLSDHRNAKLLTVEYLTNFKYNPTDDKLFNFLYWYENYIICFGSKRIEPIDENNNIVVNVKVNDDGFVPSYYNKIVIYWLKVEIDVV